MPEDSISALQGLSKVFHESGLEFGVGLSPFEAYRDYGTEQRSLLQEKVRALNVLSPDILAILFDDMRGDLPDLASSQIAILEDIRAVTSAKRIIFCPTYYSNDPILERVFGAMPPRYLDDLGVGLDASIDIFWTGPKVCSTNYPREHLVRIAEQLQRKPFLWDNYPVNDGKVASAHLYLKAFEERGPELADLLSGHAVNPMKQPLLSRIPLATLPLSYAGGAGYDPAVAFSQSVRRECGDAVAQLICEDVATFHSIGLLGISEEQRSRLVMRYSHYADDPFCIEILRWLRGEYAFDPACLTE
jgi:hypothetical protein